MIVDKYQAIDRLQGGLSSKGGEMGSGAKEETRR